jgi:two-component system, LytTR family, response regulator
MKIRTIIIDDESLVRKDIKAAISKHPEIEILCESGSVEESVTLIQACKPDLLFLDIQLSGTGFDLLKQLKYLPKVIFVTAYEDFALQALKAGALDYLLKPIDEEELSVALSKIAHVNNLAAKEHFQNAQEYLNGIKEKLVIRTNDGAYIVWFNELMYCKSDGPYTYFTLLDGRKIVVSKTIKEFEALLPEHQFIRCHNSYIVNIKEVVKLDKDDHLVLRNKELIPVSSRKRETVLIALS